MLTDCSGEAMRKVGLVGVISVALVAFGWADSSHAQEPDYVRVCDAFGTGFFYVPGATDTCIRTETGDVRTQTDEGLIRRDSKVSARVRVLESWNCDDCYAVIRPNGSPVEGAELESAARTGEGQYEVEFSRRITRCGISATLGSIEDSGETAFPGFVTVGEKPESRRTVLVHTFNTRGIHEDRAFSVSFECVPRQPFGQLCNDFGCFGDRRF